MRLIVCGGRHYSDIDHVFDALDAVLDRNGVSLVIHGDATGADALAKSWAIARGIPHQPMPADWDLHGRAAGPLRNTAMLGLNPDGVVAFPGGSGTADMVRQAARAGVKVWQPAKLKSAQ